jgi:hypothetical protein
VAVLNRRSSFFLDELVVFSMNLIREFTDLSVLLHSIPMISPITITDQRYDFFFTNCIEAERAVALTEKNLSIF